MKQHRERGVSPGGALSVLAVVGVLILVSLPRLQAFALAENEADAAALTRALGEELQRRLAPGAPHVDGSDAPALSLALLAGEAGLDARRDDVEWLEGGRVLRRHGYLFELSGPPGGACLRAWPWAYGDTGRAAFAFRPAAGVVRHGNPSGAWTGPGRGPALEGPGWAPVAAESDPTAF